MAKYLIIVGMVAVLAAAAFLLFGRGAGSSSAKVDAAVPQTSKTAFDHAVEKHERKIRPLMKRARLIGSLKVLRLHRKHIKEDLEALRRDASTPREELSRKEEQLRSVDRQIADSKRKIDALGKRYKDSERSSPDGGSN